MKKFLSMVLAAAMVISTVPATAFALDAKATAKVVGSLDLTETDATKVEEKSTVTGHTFIGGSTDYKAPELQLKVTDASYTEDDKKTAPETKFTVSLDNAKFVDKTGAVVTAGNTDQKANFAITVVDDSVLNGAAAPAVSNVKVNDNDEIEVTVTGILEKDDIIKVALNSVLTKTSTGTKATVAVDSDDLDLSTDDITFATVQDDGIKVTLKKVAEVAEEETTELEKDLKIEAAAGDFVQGQEFEIKVSSGFELRTPATQKGTGYTIKQGDDDNKLIVAASSKTDTITVDARDIIIDAATAKSGAVAKLTVKAVKDSTDPKTGKVTEVAGSFKATAEAVEAAKVVGQTVTLSVDEDEDVPVIYSGVDADNHGITDDSDHKSLEVTLKESAAGALDVKKAFNLDLPEGVYVTEVKVKKDDNAVVNGVTDVKEAFEEAYKKGEYDGFEFARKRFTATDDKDINDKMELSFELTLVAEPDFEGDVVLKLTGDAFDKDQEVTIAKFVKPYTVEAQQNDMIIDYRNTKVPTNVVVKEAEEGLWKKGLDFTFGIDKFNDKDFENDATYKVDDKSGLEIKEAKNGLGFKVDTESDDSAAAVTISDISLYMARSIAAGAYDLQLITNANIDMYAEELATTETVAARTVENAFATTKTGGNKILSKSTWIIGYKMAARLPDLPEFRLK